MAYEKPRTPGTPPPLPKRGGSRSERSQNRPPKLPEETWSNKRSTDSISARHPLLYKGAVSGEPMTADERRRAGGVMGDGLRLTPEEADTLERNQNRSIRRGGSARAGSIDGGSQESVRSKIEEIRSSIRASRRKSELVSAERLPDDLLEEFHGPAERDDDPEVTIEDPADEEGDEGEDPSYSGQHLMSGPNAEPSKTVPARRRRAGS